LDKIIFLSLVWSGNLRLPKGKIGKDGLAGLGNVGVTVEQLETN